MSSKYDKYFARINAENKHLYQWTCRLCGLVTVPTIHTTTEIRRHHLKTKHPQDFAGIEPRKPIVPLNKKRKAKIDIIANTPLKILRTENDINSDKIDNAILELICSSSLPLSTINDPAFDRLIKLLNPIYILKNADYFMQEKLPELYTSLSTKIKAVTSNLNHYSIVINIWKEEGFSRSLLAFTIHFLDDELKPQHFVLAVQPLNLDKIMLKLCDQLQDVFVEFNLDWAKVTHILQAGNCESEDLQSDPEWDVEICLALGLQQSVDDAMKNVTALDTVIIKVKKLIRKLKKPKALNQVFIDYQKLEEMPEKYFESNVKIFWNLLYSIFLSFQHSKITLQAFCVENGIKEEYSLNQNEWELLEEFIDSLSGFYQAASLLTRPDTTISSIIPIIKVIMLDLETKKKSGKGNAGLIDGLLISLQKRFSASLTNQNNIIATLLDPRFKDKYFSSTMNNCYKEWIINDLIGGSADGSTVIVPKVEVIDDEIDNANDDGDLFAAFEKANEAKRRIPSVGEEKKQLIEAELIKYLHEPKISRESSPSDFWHINSSRFPYLKQLYCKHATAPAINIEADKFFSISGAELDKMQKSMKNELVKQMLFVNCNFKLI